MENYAYGMSYIPEFPIDLIIKWSYLYIAYIFLINTNVKYEIYILKTSITLLLINVSLIYLDFLGFIDVAGIASGTEASGGRMQSKINLNIVADMGVLAVFCIYWLRYLGYPFKIFNKKIPNFIYVIYFSSLILLQASRGSLVLLLGGFIIYSLYKWKFLKASKKVLIIFSISIVSLFQLNIIENYLNKISVFNRFKETSLSVDEAEEKADGRFLQVIASYNNFMSSPIIGVGYERAAKKHFSGITRSNFQYTQILAGGGIVLFTVYFFMVFKFFAHSIQLINKDIIVKSILVFVLIAFLFRRPEPYFAVMAYMVFGRVQYRNKKYLL